MRLTTWTAAVVVVALVPVANAALGDLLTGPARTPSPAVAAAPAAAAGPVPGTDPSVQRWWLSVDQAKVRFNDALQQAQTAVAAQQAGACQPLSASVSSIQGALPRLRLLPNGGAKLADALVLPLNTFSQAAKACLAGDFVTAQSALLTGAPQQAAAQLTIDEILDGDL
ncbi:MAG: hypothetical protein JWN35_2100 [Frankiales bacterium]|jgi:hypothetical protein|nr:hypothetical protein [Frankiales bacterium]